MAGFSSITGDESIIFGNNVSFDGTKRGGKITTNGQLLIGSSDAPHIRPGLLTSTGGTVTITNGAGTINLESASSGVPKIGFLAQATNQANVTGDGTIYTLTFTQSEVFDTGNNFSTSNFTAPYTGVYLLGSNVEFYGLGAANTSGLLYIVTTATPFSSILYTGNIGAAREPSGNILWTGGSILLPMTAGNTAQVRVAVSGGTKTVGIASSTNTVFWGHLVYQTP